ncbi:ABC transporter permease subunit [Actinomycetota bacterium Odt1-20B]
MAADVMTTAEGSPATELRAAMAFEWIKIRTLRSTVWNLGLFLVVSVAVAVLTGSVMRNAYDDMGAESKADFDAVATGFGGLRLGLIALVVFGVLTVTSEYSSGTINSSLTAVPRRGVLYTAKVLTGTATAFVASVVVVAAGFFATQLSLGGALAASVSDTGAVRALVGAVLYTTLLCAFSIGLAAVLRSSALTMGLLVPLFFMVSTILNSLPGVRKFAQFLPDVAGSLILSSRPAEDTVLTAWTGMAVLAAWTALALALGYVALRRRNS